MSRWHGSWVGSWVRSWFGPTTVDTTADASTVGRGFSFAKVVSKLSSWVAGPDERNCFVDDEIRYLADRGGEQAVHEDDATRNVESPDAIAVLYAMDREP